MDNRAGRIIIVPNMGYSAYQPQKLPSLNQLDINSDMLELLG